LLFAITNPFTEPLRHLLIQLHAMAGQLPLPSFVSAWAVALILIAVIINVIILPLTISQRRSMRGMQEVQPKLKELQRQFKDDREKLAQAQMELYRQHGVNPLGGCLPIAIQMVVLFAMYGAIYGFIQTHELDTARFLWIPSLGVCEPSPFCPAAKVGIPILNILMVVMQFAYQKFATPPSADPQAQAMNQSMMFMPLMLAFIFVRMPSGLVLYYTTFTLVSVAVQAFITRRWAVPQVATAVPTTVADGAGGDTDESARGQEELKINEQSQFRRRRRKKNR